MHSNAFEILSDNEDDVNEIDVETVLSIESSTSIDKHLHSAPLITMHNLFQPDENIDNDIVTVVSCDNQSAKNLMEKEDLLGQEHESKDQPSPCQIKKLVESWRKECTLEEYDIAAKRMACLHRLLQLQDEISKGLEVHTDSDALAALNETIGKLQAEVVRTNDIEVIEYGIIEAEKSNVHFGLILHTLGYKVADDNINRDRNTISTVNDENQNESGIVHEMNVKRSSDMSNEPSSENVHLDTHVDPVSEITDTDDVNIQKGQTYFDTEDIGDSGPDNVTCDEKVDAQTEPPHEDKSQTVKNLNKDNAIEKTPYYIHFMEKVTVFKDCIRDDIDGYKRINNDKRVRDFLNMVQRLQKLIQFVPRNMNQQLYETKCKKLEKMRDTAMMYRNEDGFVEYK